MSAAVAAERARERPLRIAHVLPALTKGGGERVAVELIREAAAAGHDVTCVAGWEAPPPGVRDLVPPSVRVEYVSTTRRGAALRAAHAAWWVWRRRAWLRELDVLHCHLTFGAFVGTYVSLARRALGARRPAIVETYHAVGMAIPATSRRVHRMLAAHRDALVLMADDDEWRRFAERHPRLVGRTILNGASDPRVDLVTHEQRRAYRRRLGIGDDCRLVVGTVGLLRADRKPWVWIPIFAEIARAVGPAVHFVMVGGGPEEERIRTLIREHDLEGRVHVTGTVDQVREPLSIMDLYLTVNVGRVTGIGALEAALAGLPLLAVQFVQDRAASDDDWIWSSADGDAIAGRAIALLEDDAARHALAARQRAYARRHHSTEVMAAAYEEVYRDALARIDAEATAAT